MKLRSILTLLLGAVGLLAISATVALIILSSLLHDAGVRIATAVDRVRLVMDLESRVLQRMQQPQAPDDGHVSRILAELRQSADADLAEDVRRLEMRKSRLLAAEMTPARAHSRCLSPIFAPYSLAGNASLRNRSLDREPKSFGKERECADR